MTKRQTLYRMYDEAGALLYIGITQQQAGRFHQHSRDKSWWDEVTQIRVQHYPDRAAVEAAEMAAIAAECPRYNIVGNNGSMRRLMNRSIPDGYGYGTRGTSWRPEAMRCTLVRKRGGGMDPIEHDLVLWWELDHETITDDYTADEIDAFDLFDRWVRITRRRVARQGTVDLPIWWFVVGSKVCEFAGPSDDYPDGPHFAKFYYLGDGSGRYQIDIDALPVADKKWTTQQADKGGFIQQVTGWQPNPLQPTVSLDFLWRRAIARRSA